MKAVLLAVLGISVVLAACDSGKQAGSMQAPTTSTQTAPTVESSLDGLTVLPSRIRWSATTSLPSEQVREVRFLVDDYRLWVDRSPPYTYGPDGAYLATRWATSSRRGPDLHAFTVKVIGENGERLAETVHARTPKANVARNTPGNFGGYLGFYGWGRLSAADLADPPREALLQSYTGRITFGRASLFSANDDAEFAWEISSSRRRLRIGTPIYLSRAGRIAVLCAPDGPPATYAWSMTRGRLLRSGVHYTHYLHLRALHEPCVERRRMLDGIWEDIQD
jgi:hypothetical protein